MERYKKQSIMKKINFVEAHLGAIQDKFAEVKSFLQLERWLGFSITEPMKKLIDPSWEKNSHKRRNFLSCTEAGVYKITIGGETYVGSTINIHQRENMLMGNLKRGTYANHKMQKAYNAHQDVVFEILEKVEDESQLIRREQYWIDQINPTLNVSKMADKRMFNKFNMNRKMKTPDWNMSIYMVTDMTDGQVWMDTPSRLERSMGWPASVITTSMIGRKEYLYKGKYLIKKMPTDGIAQIKDGQIIAVYNRLSDACVAVGAPKTSYTFLREVCEGKRYTFKGYNWTFLSCTEVEEWRNNRQINKAS